MSWRLHEGEKTSNPYIYRQKLVLGDIAKGKSKKGSEAFNDTLWISKLLLLGQMQLATCFVQPVI